MKPQTEKLRSVICNRTNDACVTNEYFSFKVIVCVICTLIWNTKDAQTLSHEKGVNPRMD